MNKIEIKPAKFRNTRYIDDIFIDGESLNKTLSMGDFISPFGWLNAKTEMSFAENFLLKNESILGEARYKILVCSECADISCGALTATIRKTSSSYIWENIGFQNDCKENIEIYEKVGPYEFSYENYYTLFNGIISYNKAKL